MMTTLLESKAPKALLLCAAVILAFLLLLEPAQAHEEGEGYVDLDIEVGMTFRRNLHYLLIATNHGTADAHGVKVYLEDTGEQRIGRVSSSVGEFLDGYFADDVWIIGSLPAGESAKLQLSKHKPAGGGVGDRLYPLTARITHEWPPEEERFLANNVSPEIWAFFQGSESPWSRFLVRPSVQVDNLSPSAGDNVTFTVGVNVGSGGLEITYSLLALDLGIQLSGLALAQAPQPPMGTSFDGSPPVSSGIWKLEEELPGSSWREIEIVAALNGDMALEERCLTLTLDDSQPPPDAYSGTDSYPHWGWNQELWWGMGMFTVCLGEEAPPHLLVSEGVMDINALFPCVGIDTYPCDSEDSLELQAMMEQPFALPRRTDFTTPELSRIRLDTVIQLDRDNTVIQVRDSHLSRVVSTGNVSWRTAKEGREQGGLPMLRENLSHVHADGGWRDGRDKIAATALDGGAKPGTVSVKVAASDFEIANADNTGFSVTYAFVAEPLNLYYEFGALGTYVIERAYKGIHDNDTPSDTSDDMEYTASATYTFHVGPVADLEVRDGAPNSALPPNQTAFTIVAVNNGPDATHNAAVTVSLPNLPQGATCASHTASAGEYDPSSGVWTIGELHHKDYFQIVHGREGETLTIHCDAAVAGLTATATIANDNAASPYTVTIDDGDENTDDVYTGTVLDHIGDNDSADITAAAGARPTPTGLAATPETHTAVLLTWDALGSFLGADTTHYEIEYLADTEGAQWTTLVANTESFDAGDREGTAALETEYRHFTRLAGHDPQYRVRAWNADGERSAPSAVAAASLPAVAAHMVPDSTETLSTSIWTGYDAPVAGEPVTVRLDDRGADYLARIQATPSESDADPCVGEAPRPGITVPSWVWQSSSDYTDDGNDNNDTWADIPDDGGATYVYTPVSGDVGKFLRATLTFGSPSVTAVTDVFGPVVGAAPAGVATADGAASIDGAAQAGATLTAQFSPAVLSRGVDIADRWQWERSDDYTDDGDDSNDTWVNVTRYSGCAALLDSPHQYTPDGGDAGSYFRAYVYYTDGDGNLKRAQTGVAGPVAAE